MKLDILSQINRVGKLVAVVRRVSVVADLHLYMYVCTLYLILDSHTTR